MSRYNGQPIKAICRELGVSRKVVRKVIHSEATELQYERETQPLPKIGPWSAELDRLLGANESKAARKRLTLIRLFEELRATMQLVAMRGAGVRSVAPRQLQPMCR